MKKIFLTSGLAMIMASSAFATAHDINYDATATPNYSLDTVGGNPSCQEPTLGNYTGPSTFYAKWNAKTYNVTYAHGSHGSGGQTLNNAATFDTDYNIRGLGADTTTKSGVTANTGYHFTGWLGTSTGGVDATYDALSDEARTYSETGTVHPYSIVGPLTLTAQWDPNKSGTITLNADIYEDNDRSNNATPLYYNAPDGANQTEITTPLGTSTVYSIYNVGLYTTNAFTTPVTPANMVPANNGYTFNGFYDGTIKVIDNDGSVLPAALIAVSEEDGTDTWYANWSQNTYDVKYHAGTAKNGSTTHTPSYPSGGTATVTKTATFDETYTIASNNLASLGGGSSTTTPYFSQTGYTFTGWAANYDIANDTATALNADHTSGGTAYQPGDAPTYKVHQGGVELYAQWAPKTYETWYYNNHCGTFTASDNVHNAANGVEGQFYIQPDNLSGSLKYDSIYTTLTPAQIGLNIKTGWTFNGWATTTSANATILAAGQPMPAAWTTDAHMQVYASCTANQYTLTYDCGKYVDSNHSIDKTADYIGTLASAHVFTKTFDNTGETARTPSEVCKLNGYHVTTDAWTCVVTGTSTPVSYADVTTENWSVPNHVTCSVSWDANNILLNWRPGDNATAQNDQTYSAGENTGSCKYDLGINVGAAPKKPGYTFKGWTVDPHANGVIDSSVTNP